MFVKRLILQNYRNYNSVDVSFGNDRIYILGNNGIGKTNIIESIYYLTLGRSFRKADDQNLIQKGHSSASIYLDFFSEKDNKDHQLSCVIGSSYKAFAYDNEKVKSLSKILGKMIAVYYDPSLVFFFKGEPEQRRKLLDETCSQLSSEYLFAVSRYKKLLKERNAALQQNYDEDVITVLRNELINLSFRIIHDRKELIRELSEKSSYYYQKLFGTDEKKFSLNYKTSSPLDDNQNEFVSHSISCFEKVKSLESIKKITLIGPHRDDLIGCIDENEIASFGSQGENRIASLSIKLATLDIIREKLGVSPLLLLDDVTSDLDDIRCQNLLSCIDKENQQVFVTGTQFKNHFKNYQIYKVDNNSIHKEDTQHE